MMARSVAFIGFGSIVKLRHIPALRHAGFDGEILPYNLDSRRDADTGIHVRTIGVDPVEETDMVVVASPPSAHADAIEHIKPATTPVVIEKPLTLKSEDLDRWIEFTAGRPAPVLVCHNYRFKLNVLHVLQFLIQHNPGRLIHVHIEFHSPSVRNDPVAWRQEERQTRTLLLDYGVHLFDLALMLSRPPFEPWTPVTRLTAMETPT